MTRLAKNIGGANRAKISYTLLVLLNYVLTEAILLIGKIFAVIVTITNECLVNAMTVLNTYELGIQARSFSIHLSVIF